MRHLSDIAIGIIGTLALAMAGAAFIAGAIAFGAALPILAIAVGVA